MAVPNNPFQLYLDGSYNSTMHFFCLTSNRSANCSLPALPPEEYFEYATLTFPDQQISVFNSNYVLRRSNSLEDMGSPHWSLTLCLLLAWILVAACIIQGIKSSGKVQIRISTLAESPRDNFRLCILLHYFHT